MVAKKSKKMKTNTETNTNGWNEMVDRVSCPPAKIPAQGFEQWLADMKVIVGQNQTILMWVAGILFLLFVFGPAVDWHYVNK